MGELNLKLDDLARGANFIRNSQEPLNDISVKGADDFWYRLVGLQEPEAAYILDFDQDHQEDIGNAKVFYLEEGQFTNGVDLDKDKPKYWGNDVVNLLLFNLNNKFADNSKGSYGEQ